MKKIVKLFTLLIALILLFVVAACGNNNNDPQHEHKFVKHEAIEPTCLLPGAKSYYTCEGCDGIFADENGTTATLDNMVIAALGHNAGEAKRENVVEATCTNAGSYDEVTYCTRCNTELSREAKSIEKLAHTPGEEKQENLVAATCLADGSYDKVTYCTVCNTELSRESVKLDKLAHVPGEAVIENNVAATCLAEGSYDEVIYCTLCNSELSRNNITVPQLVHEEGDIVIENEVPATCSIAGSYDEVVYCTLCNTELSRDTFTEEKLPHTPADSVIENAVATSCSKAGSYDEVVYCSVCGEEISRETKSVDKLAHTPGEEQRENDIESTCSAAGSYDMVIRCTVCNEVISSQTFALPLASHDLVHYDAKESDYTISGNLEYWQCSVCKQYFLTEEATEAVQYSKIVLPKKAFEGTMDELLELIEFEDKEVIYNEANPKKTSIVYNGIRPTGVKITCTPTTKYQYPGEYPYTLTITYNGEVREIIAYLRIVKPQPEYLGDTEYNVYLNNPASQPSFKFSNASVKAVNPPIYTEPGDYEYILTTYETSRYAPIDPVTITYHVYDSILPYTFEGMSVVGDGTEIFSIYLVPNDPSYELDPQYEIKYFDNASSRQGKHYSIAQIIDKDTREVIDEWRAILDIDYLPNEEFDEFVNEYFIDYVGDDQLTINIFTVNPENFGLERADAIWYTWKGFIPEGYDTLEEVYNHDRLEVAQEKERLAYFQTQKLSYGQLVSLRRIQEVITFYDLLLKSEEYAYIGLGYVDQYGGYIADFPTDMEAYQLRTRQDIEDYISYFTSMPDALASYFDFIVAKKDTQYAFSRFTLESFNKYIDGVVKAYESNDGYYITRVALAKLAQAKIDLELTDDEYNDYYTRLETASIVDVYNAHKDLYNNVKSFLETETYFDDPDFTGVYYGETKASRDYYFASLQNRLGIFNLTPEEYLAQVEAYLAHYKELFMAHPQLSTQEAEDISDGKTKVFDYGEDVLSTFDFLKEFAKIIVPDLESMPEIDVTWMDKTVTENTTTAAYYMKSPLDSYDKEYIHLNGKSLGENNYETMATIAHEGYPGHLYAYVNTKENQSLSNFVRIATYTGHGEGWAKYVEYRFNQYLADIHADSEDAEAWLEATTYNRNWDMFIYMFYARADFGINYQGWGTSEIKSFLSDNGLKSSDETALDLFNTLNEAAGQYAPYGYGPAVFVELHEMAEEALGAYYDEVEFNGLLLAHGWCSLDSLREYVLDYIDQYNFLLRK